MEARHVRIINRYTFFMAIILGSENAIFFSGGIPVRQVN
jgi:hypothetical protein